MPQEYRHHPQIHNALAALRDGGVIAYPTEAVWGLGCDVWNGDAVARVLALKGRSPAKGLILVADSVDRFAFILNQLDPQLRDKLAGSWPGPITWLVPHANRLPLYITGRHPTVALRVSRHPVVSTLCGMLGRPIVSTSANPQGSRAARYGFQVRRYFGDQVIYAPGAVDLQARPSRIQDLLTDQVLRH